MSLGMRLRASFIVTCYIYGRFVAPAVDSLLGQIVEALEVIVIEDASSDDSARVPERYRGDPGIRLVLHVRNTGHIHRRTYAADDRKYEMFAPDRHSQGSNLVMRRVSHIRFSPALNGRRPIKRSLILQPRKCGGTGAYAR